MGRPRLADSAGGTHREALEALRDYLADALDNTDSPRDQAPLSNRYQAVLAELAEIDKEGDDELDGLLGASPTDQVGA